MKILIVDDQKEKSELLATVVRSFDSSTIISHSGNAQDGFQAAVSGAFNLVLLDVVLPLGLGSPASEDGSLWFVREAYRKLKGPMLPLIIGTTQYAESLVRVEDTFREYLWSVIHVSDQNDRWQRQLQHAFRFARSNAPRLRLARDNEVGTFDFAIVTALRIPEFTELVDALGGGDPIHLSETNETWMHCKSYTSLGQEINVVAACADDMGMTAMTSLVTRLCIMCQPATVILVGIMGGNSEHVGLSDLINIEETWDCRAGKITEEGFEADVKQRTCDFKLANKVTAVISEEFLLEFWRSWKGERPDRIPCIRKGAVACSPAVIADAAIFAQLESQKRKILGVEMEAYGCYDAVRRLGDLAPNVICIKSVCDLGDKKKNDKYQRFCAAISSAAAVKLIKDDTFYNAKR